MTPLFHQAVQDFAGELYKKNTRLTSRATAENWAYAYPFQFLKSGWYMFVVNQTWIQPTVVRAFWLQQVARSTC